VPQVGQSRVPVPALAGAPARVASAVPRRLTAMEPAAVGVAAAALPLLAAAWGTVVLQEPR
jgi:hypothetical protein